MQDIEPADDQHPVSRSGNRGSRQSTGRAGDDLDDWFQAARWPANLNAALWGLGNGLVSSTLVVYLVISLGAAGIGVSLILAAPQLIGLGRLGAARFTRDGQSRKRFCIVAYLGSGLVLAALPVLAIRREHFLPGVALGGVVAVWCLYHLLEYLATVALWAWLGDLVSPVHRGLFIGRRERWLNAGRTLGMLAGGLFAWQCQMVPEWKWAAYSVPAAAGAVMFIVAVVPLIFMPIGAAEEGATPSGSPSPRPMPSFRWRYFLTPLIDTRLSRLVIYGCWFSFFNGLTQAAQGVFPARVLDLPLIWLLGFRTAMNVGQTLVSPRLGRWADRFGNRPVVFVSQVVVALGLAGYMLATEERWWLIGFAWLAWVAYAGINVGVPNLLLRLSPPEQAGACIAAYFALTGLCYGLSTIVGGFVFDNLQGVHFLIRGWSMDRYSYLFYFGVVSRLLGAILLLAIDEPRPEGVPQVAVRPDEAPA